MSTVHRLPDRREVFVDPRGADRGMRVTCHPDEGIVVISLWHGGLCTGSFRLPLTDCSRMMAVLAGSLSDQDAGQTAATAVPTRRPQAAEG